MCLFYVCFVATLLFFSVSFLFLLLLLLLQTHKLFISIQSDLQFVVPSRVGVYAADKNGLLNYCVCLLSTVYTLQLHSHLPILEIRINDCAKGTTEMCVHSLFVGLIFFFSVYFSSAFRVCARHILFITLSYIAIRILTYLTCGVFPKNSAIFKLTQIIRVN